MREGNPTQGLLRARGEGGCAEFRCGVWRGAQARCLGAELRRGVWARSLAQNEAWSLARSFFGAEFGLSAEFWRGVWAQRGVLARRVARGPLTCR